MVSFEELLDSLEANGYTIISMEYNDDPYKRNITLKDTNGTIITKTYVMSINEVTDANGNVIGADEDWIEL